METRMTIKELLEQMDRLCQNQNRQRVHNLKTFVGKIPLPVYLNYEQFGNGLNYHLNRITAKLKQLAVVDMEIDSYLDYHAEYDNDTKYSLAERLKRLLESQSGEQFSGVLLIHIDDWVDAGEVSSKEFASAMRYLEEKRDKLMLILQINEEKVEDKDALEELLAPFFNVKVVYSVPLEASEMKEYVLSRLSQLGYMVTGEFEAAVEEISEKISQSEIIDQYHQVMLMLEDIVYEKVMTGESDNMLDEKLLESFSAKIEQLSSGDKARKIGFATED